MEQTKDIYELKCVNYMERRVNIILQNENGPCPLIAIGNVLALTGRISIDTDRSRISLSDLTSMIAEYMMEANSELRQSLELKQDYEKNVNDAISILPEMQFGLDVNVKFKHVKDFEYSPQCVIFDLLNIDLVHGWLPSEENKPMFDLISPLSYNQIVEKLLASDVLQSDEQTKSQSPEIRTINIKGSPGLKVKNQNSQSGRYQRGSCCYKPTSCYYSIIFR
eukprot:TRINITY_DN8072_c0_g1_i1.p1 TRINITY_DN8072_c0_g1~~TRINITY_DN8072_c0_g1_i1.p1  ORF type:complete len:222 (+),score=35.08 TRINITY_DN8072_c0_g1_i1:135-800(+)